MLNRLRRSCPSLYCAVVSKVRMRLCGVPLDKVTAMSISKQNRNAGKAADNQPRGYRGRGAQMLPDNWVNGFAIGSVTDIDVQFSYIVESRPCFFEESSSIADRDICLLGSVFWREGWPKLLRPIKGRCPFVRANKFRPRC